MTGRNQTTFSHYKLVCVSISRFLSEKSHRVVRLTEWNHLPAQSHKGWWLVEWTPGFNATWEPQLTKKHEFINICVPVAIRIRQNLNLVIENCQWKQLNCVAIVDNLTIKTSDMVQRLRLSWGGFSLPPRRHGNTFVGIDTSMVVTYGVMWPVRWPVKMTRHDWTEEETESFLQAVKKESVTTILGSKDT